MSSSDPKLPPAGSFPSLLRKASPHGLNIIDLPFDGEKQEASREELENDAEYEWIEEIVEEEINEDDEAIRKQDLQEAEATRAFHASREGVPFSEYPWDHEEPYPLPVPPEMLDPNQRSPANHDGLFLPVGRDLDYSIGENYPRLKWVHYSERDPYAKWDDPFHRRNFNEPVHHADYLLNVWSPSPVTTTEYWGSFSRLAMVFLVAFAAWWADENDEHSRTRQYASIEYNFPDSEETKRLLELIQLYGNSKLPPGWSV